MNGADEYFAKPPSSEEYPFTVCGQTVMLSNPDLAAALSSLPEAVNAVLAHYAGYIRYYSHIYGHYNVDMEDYIKTKLIESLSKFRLDR